MKGKPRILEVSGERFQAHEHASALKTKASPFYAVPPESCLQLAVRIA